MDFHLILRSRIDCPPHFYQEFPNTGFAAKPYSKYFCDIFVFIDDCGGICLSQNSMQVLLCLSYVLSAITSEGKNRDRKLLRIV